MSICRKCGVALPIPCWKVCENCSYKKKRADPIAKPEVKFEIPEGFRIQFKEKKVSGSKYKNSTVVVCNNFGEIIGYN